jgi:septal ring factor EnvC (AmiA/AmiB activator)
VRDIDYRRLSIEKEKVERELEKERRKQQKEAEEFSKKFDRLDRELEKFREAEKLMRLEKRDRVTSSQDRPINNDSVSRVYKRMGGSKGFLAPPTTSNDER